MSMDFKFRPGIQTSLNSSANIKSNIAAKKTGEGETSGVQNSAGKTAAENLAKTNSLSTNNWDANSSVFNIKNTGTTTNDGNIAKKSSNFVSHGYGGSTTSRATNSSGFTRDKNYVSSGYWNKEAERADIKRMQLTGEGNYGVSRMPGSTGGNRRSGLREEQRDAEMERYIYEKTHPQIKETFWQKAAGIATGIAGAAGVVASGVELGKNIASLFSKSSKSGGGGDGTVQSAKSQATAQNTGTAATPSREQSAAVSDMEKAQDSATLGNAINSAKDEAGKMDDNINQSKATASEAKAANSGLKKAAKQEEKQAKAATKEVKTHNEAAAKYKQNAAEAKGAMDGYQARIDSNTQTMNNNNTTIGQNDQKMGEINQKLGQLKEPKKPAADADAATQAQYQRDLADYNKTKKELENQKSELEKQNDNLKTENTKLNEENGKLDGKLKQYETKYNEAKEAESKETSLASEAQKTADKETKEAKDAQEAYNKNNAKYQAAKETVSDLQQQQSNLNSSIKEQESRRKEMMKNEEKSKLDGQILTRQAADSLVDKQKTVIKAGHKAQPIEAYYGKDPESGEMRYIDSNGNEYTKEAFNSWETLAKDPHAFDK